MKFSHKTFLSLSSLFFMVAFFTSCEDQSKKIKSEIIGTWFMAQPLNRFTNGMSASDVGGQSLNAWNYSTVITTNSNQKLIDRMAKPEGSINVSGFVNDELNYMVGWQERESQMSYVSVTNYDWLRFFEEGFEEADLIDPIITISMINFDNGNEEFEQDFIGINFEDESYVEFIEKIDYSFNGMTLNLPFQTFNRSDTVISIGGELSYATIDIQANTPTSIFSYNDDTSWEYGAWTIHIKEDGRWIEVYTWEDDYGVFEEEEFYTDSTIAKWRLEDDQIVVTYEYDDVYFENEDGFGLGQGSWLYEVRYSFELANNTLYLTNEDYFCDGEPECMYWMEYEYGLDEGSLEEIKMVWNLEFSKSAPDARGRNISPEVRSQLRKFPPFNFIKN